jgi:hypothetical protein
VQAKTDDNRLPENRVNSNAGRIIPHSGAAIRFDPDIAGRSLLE